MIELKRNEQLKMAIDRARAERKSLLVKMTGVARQYLVVNRNTNKVYTVSFSVKFSGQKFASCDCKAGMNNRLCKHVAAAAGLNVCLAEQGLLNRQQTQSLQTA